MIDAQTISEALGGKRAGKGYLACCPAHDDHHPSLSIDDGHNGKPVVFCNVGCRQEAVIAALADLGLWPERDGVTLSREEIRTLQENAARRKAEANMKRLAEQQQAAVKAKVILTGAVGDPVGHAYAMKKKVSFGPLVKRGHWAQRGWSDALLVPLYDEQGAVVSVQAINENLDDKKDFLYGGRKKGCFHPLGKSRGVTGRVLIGEGLATVAAAVSATGLPGVVAFDAGNLQHVAEVVRRLAPDAEVVLLADDDQKEGTDKNPGLEDATRAALAVGGKVALPAMGKKADFWDVWNEQGTDAVRQAIEAAALVEDQHGDQEEAPAQVQGRGQEWPEPLPLITREQAAPYPLDALPETIGKAVREVVGFVQCPVALGACSALSVVSAVGQGLVDVRRAAKLEGPTSLFLLAVADSGERKTTVDGFFSKPVQQWEAEQAEAAKPELNKYQADSEAWAAKKGGLLTAIKEAAKAGKSTGNIERSLAELETDKPERPKVPRLLYADTTPEGLAHRLAHGWPVGGVLSSEAGTVLGSHGMKSDSAMRNMALLNSLWGAEPLTVDRRDESGSFALRGARLTMGLAVQSETVRAFLDNSKGLARGIGWLARFLVAWPESTQGGRMFKEPPEHWPCLAKFHRRLGVLLDHQLTFNERGELVPETLELSPEAKAVWVAFHDDVEAELKPGRDMAEAKDVASKAADNAARLAGLFHLFEIGHSGCIGAGHMRQAAAVASWHLYEARRFMGEIALPPQLNNAAKLDAWLLEYCQEHRVVEISTREVQRTGPNCTRERGSRDGALQELAEAGRVQIVESKRRRLIKINPALLGR